MSDYLLLRADWAGRDDPVETQIDQMWRCLQSLTGRGGMLAKRWYARRLAPEQNRPVDSFDDLREAMTGSLTASTIPFYLFTQLVDNNEPADRAYAWLWASIANPGPAGPIANSVILHLESGTGGDGALPFGLLVGDGPGLVKGFVDAWNPDAVRFTEPSLESLFDIEVGDEEWAYALPGYFLWLAESVMPPEGMPDAPYRESYGGGTLIGVDPTGSDPFAQANELIDWRPVYDCDLNPLRDE